MSPLEDYVEHILSVRSPKRHSWIWYKSWKFWQKPARVCVRCRSMLRMEPAGPRGGARYSYREVGTIGYVRVDRLPECRGTTLEESPSPRR